MRKALITGIYGQDGSYLAEILEKKGYDIRGIVHIPLSDNSIRIKDELHNKGLVFPTEDISLTNYNEVKKVVNGYKPDEIYHLAARHFSAEDAGSKAESDIFADNIKSTANILEACYNENLNAHIVTAGSCLMYDSTDTTFQSEKTMFSSKSYYGIAKITENMLVKMYRDKGLFACTAILYNHESHRRSDSFVTRKIIKNLVAIKKGKIKRFTLGDLEAKKDWGYAKDYAYGMHLMAQQNKPRDIVLATGQLHSIEEFVIECARQLGIDDWRRYIEIDDRILLRKNETILRGDATLAYNELNWKHTLDFKELIQVMIEAEKV